MYLGRNIYNQREGGGGDSPPDLCMQGTAPKNSESTGAIHLPRETDTPCAHGFLPLTQKEELPDPLNSLQILHGSRVSKEEVWADMGAQGQEAFTSSLPALWILPRQDTIA